MSRFPSKEEAKLILKKMFLPASPSRTKNVISASSIPISSVSRAVSLCPFSYQLIPSPTRAAPGPHSPI